MAAILVTLFFFVWAALALTALPERPSFSKIRIWRPRHPTLVILALLLGAIGFYVRYHFPNPNEVDNWFWSFVIDLAPEMVGMAFTVVVIDELNQRRLEQQEKDRLFAQVKSPVRDIAVEALRLIRENDWLDEVLEKYNYNLTQFQWQGADLQYANLQGANLRDAHLEGASLSCAYLEGADLKNVHMTGTDLFEANLKSANLEEANLEEAILSGANLAGADLVGANLTGAILLVANLEEANLVGANLTDVNLSGANLTGAGLSYANLQGANLIFATLLDADLFKANLMRTDLTEANLEGADLTEANLQDARLSDTKLRGAEYSRETAWPENFDFKDTGAIKINPKNLLKALQSTATSNSQSATDNNGNEIV